MSAGQKRIVVAGHVCLDVIPTFPSHASGESTELRPGHLIQVGPAVRSTGGAVSNTGLALHRLGADVRLIGRIGDDLFGAEILRQFQAHGADVSSGMVMVPGETTSYSVVINPPGIDRTFLHCPGANDAFSSQDVTSDALTGATLFHFGYPPVMRKMWANGGTELATLLKTVRESGITTSLDLCMVDPHSEAGQIDWEALLGLVLPQVDFFCPSVDELLLMLDRVTYQKIEAEGGFVPSRHLNLELLRKLSERCLKLGAAAVAIKLGDQGLYLRSTTDVGRLRNAGLAFAGLEQQWMGQELYSPCFQAALVGTTGSGDCTIAGLLAALIREETPEQVVQAAVATGAASVEAPDAVSGVPHWTVLSQRIAAGWKMHPALLRL